MCSPSVPINVAALERFCTQTNDLRHQISALWLRKLALMQDPLGAIPVSYEQVSTGRVFDVHWHLQCTPREVLSAALDGRWDYDIENAHYSIAYQWAKRLGIEAGRSRSTWITSAKSGKRSVVIAGFPPITSRSA